MAVESKAMYDGRLLGFQLKHLSLFLLIFQNSTLILLLHYSRVMPTIGGQRYITSTAVFMNEVLKFSVCFTASLFEISRNLPPSAPATALFSRLSSAIFAGDSWKLAVPASLYVAQNSLQFVAISNLSAASYQVTFQLKILPTAIFSIVLLKRRLSLRQWVSLALLMIGVAIVQIPTSDPRLAPFHITHPHWHIPRSFENWRHAGAVAAQQLSKRSATYEGIAEDEGLVEPPMNAAIGFAAAIAGCTVSALASVYFEKILKESTSSTSLWVRNVQLAFYSLFPSLFIGVMFIDGENISQHGFFVGYNWFVWVTIIFQASGGILVSLCIMYADNIAKSFAMSLSILVGLCASVWFFNFTVTTNFIIGTSIVLLATYMYTSTDGSNRMSPPPIKIHKYEKTTVDHTPARYNGTPKKRPSTPLRQSSGLSSSRPTSPTGHHLRSGSSREYFGAKSRED